MSSTLNQKAMEALGKMLDETEQKAYDLGFAAGQEFSYNALIELCKGLQTKPNQTDWTLAGLRNQLK